MNNFLLLWCWYCFVEFTCAHVDLFSLWILIAGNSHSRVGLPASVWLIISCLWTWGCRIAFVRTSWKWQDDVSKSCSIWVSRYLLQHQRLQSDLKMGVYEEAFWFQTCWDFLARFLFCPIFTSHVNGKTVLFEASISIWNGHECRLERERNWWRLCLQWLQHANHQLFLLMRWPHSISLDIMRYFSTLFSRFEFWVDWSGFIHISKT